MKSVSLIDGRYNFAGNRQTKTSTDYTVNYTLSSGNRLSQWAATSTNDFTALRTLRVEGNSSEAIGTDNRWGQLYVSNSIAITPEISGTNFWIDSFITGMGTQKVVAAIRDEAGNMGYATNEVFLTVVTNGAYQYSAAGCVTNIAYTGTQYAETKALGWNAQYQLVSVSSVCSVVSYSYDVLGRRTSRAEGTNVEHYVCDGNQVVADLDENGNLLRSYVWGAGIDNLLALSVYSPSGTNTYYALKDHLNTIHALIDVSGQIIERYEYDTWGRTTVFNTAGDELPVSAIGNRYCFQGREIEWTTGLYYFRARWYDPVVGRWLSKDPIGISGGLNLYAFCGNNPVNFTDPLGLVSFDTQKFADLIEERRFNLPAVLGTAGSTLGFGTMPKVPSELRGFGVPKGQLNPYTSQLSRWSGRFGGRTLRDLGRTVGGKALGVASTGLLIFEGFYDWGVIIRAAWDATTWDESDCKK